MESVRTIDNAESDLLDLSANPPILVAKLDTLNTATVILMSEHTSFDIPSVNSGILSSISVSNPFRKRKVLAEPFQPAPYFVLHAAL